MTKMKGVERVIENPLNFKNKLGIREDAFKHFRKKDLADKFFRILQIGGAFEAGAAIASTATVAAMFTEIGILAALGLATTPIGWVIAAGVVSAAGFYGISRFLQSSGEEGTDVVPEWIDTPLDALAVVLFDFFAPLGLKVASLDGGVSVSERRHIQEYFVREWGYSERFVQLALPELEKNVETLPIVELLHNLIEFKRHNSDCNYNALAKELTGFLKDVTEANGEIHDLEVVFIQWLEITLTRGRPGFWDKLNSAVRFNPRLRKKTEAEGGDDQGGNDGNAPNGGENQSDLDESGSSQDGRMLDSTLVGRNFRSVLRWAQDQF